MCHLLSEAFPDYTLQLQICVAFGKGHLTGLIPKVLPTWLSEPVVAHGSDSRL